MDLVRIADAPFVNVNTTSRPAHPMRRSRNAHKRDILCVIRPANANNTLYSSRPAISACSLHRATPLRGVAFGPGLNAVGDSARCGLLTVPCISHRLNEVDEVGRREVPRNAGLVAARSLRAPPPGSHRLCGRQQRDRWTLAFAHAAHWPVRFEHRTFGKHSVRPESAWPDTKALPRCDQTIDESHRRQSL